MPSKNARPVFGRCPYCEHEFQCWTRNLNGESVVLECFHCAEAFVVSISVELVHETRKLADVDEDAVHKRLDQQAADHEPEKEKRPRCSVDGCDREAQTKGMCRKHYARKYYRENLSGGRANKQKKPAEPETQQERQARMVSGAPQTLGSDGLRHREVKGSRY